MNPVLFLVSSITVVHGRANASIYNTCLRMGSVKTFIKSLHSLHGQFTGKNIALC
jgi:hypothetical protein